MAITPTAGWMVDPNNKNGVVQIPNSTPLPGIQYKTGTTEPGGGGTAPAPAPTATPYTGVQTDAQRAASYRDAGVIDPGITSTSDPVKAAQDKLAADLQKSSQRPAFDESIYARREAELAARRDAAQKTINEQFDTAKTGLADQQNRETGSTSASLARAGGYLGNSASGEGVLLTLAQSHRSEMTGLEAKRSAALNEARTAYEDKQFQLAESKYKEAKAYEQESYNRTEKYQETVGKELEAIRKQKKEESDSIDIYNAIAGGAKNETEVFQKLGGKVSVDQIGNFYSKLKPKTAETAVYKFSNDDVGKLLGAGLNPQEMQIFTDDLNTHGYASAVAGLSGSQRAVVDELLNGKKTGGVTNGLTIAEAKSLGLPPELIGMDEKVFVQSLNSPTPPPWFVHHTEQTYQQNLLPEKTLELWQTFKTSVDTHFKKADALGYDSVGGNVTKNDSNAYDSIPSTKPQPTENTDGQENP